MLFEPQTLAPGPQLRHPGNVKLFGSPRQSRGFTRMKLKTSIATPDDQNLARAKRREAALAIPLPAPVTTQTLPSNILSMLLSPDDG